MTQVRFSAADSLGLAPGEALTFELSASRLLFDTVLNFIRLPSPRRFAVPTATPVLAELAPTTSFGAGWAWRIVWSIGDAEILTLFFTVPDSVTVVNFEDLPIIDPSTLAPIGLAAAWVVEIERVRAGLQAQINGLAVGSGNVPPIASSPVGHILTVLGPTAYGWASAGGVGGFTPSAHATSHGAAGSDPVAVTQAQVTGLPAALSGKEDAGTAAAAVSTHVAQFDPHPVYLTTSEGDGRYPRTVTVNGTTRSPDGSGDINLGTIGGGGGAGYPPAGGVPRADLAAALVTEIDAKALAARNINTTAPLTGGGNLSADRTLGISVGTTAGTVAAGNDARLSDARTPTDGSVTTVKLAAALVTEIDAKLASSGGITVLTWNGTAWPAARPIPTIVHYFFAPNSTSGAIGSPPAWIADGDFYAQVV